MNLSSTRNIILILIGIIFFSCNKYADYPTPQIQFRQVSGLPAGGRASAVTFTIDDKGYMLFGRTRPDSDYLKDCWEYNPSDNRWRQKKDFPGKARVKAIAATVNGKAYVGLGFEEVPVYQGVGYLTDLWEYNSKWDLWTKRAEFPGTATSGCISFVYNNEIYVGFGFNGTGFTKEMWKYSPQNDAWENLGEFSGDARVGGVVVTDGTRVFFGTGYNLENYSDWWEYFPETNSWSKRRSMPDRGRVNGLAFCVKNRFFVSSGRRFGGDHSTGKLYTDISEYDPILNEWYYCGTVPGNGRENATTFIINNKCYIGFGETSNEILNDFWCFEP